MSGQASLVLPLGPLTAAALASSHRPTPASRTTNRGAILRAAPASRLRLTHARISAKSRQLPLADSQSVTVARRTRTRSISLAAENNSEESRLAVVVPLAVHGHGRRPGVIVFLGPPWTPRDPTALAFRAARVSRCLHATGRMLFASLTCPRVDETRCAERQGTSWETRRCRELAVLTDGPAGSEEVSSRVLSK